MLRLVALLALARAAHADCTPQAAAKELAGATWIDASGAQPSAAKPAGRIAIEHGALTVDGRAIALDKIYVQTPHHDFANLAVKLGCATKAPPAYDPRTDCQKWDDEVADGKRDLPAEEAAVAKLAGKARDDAAKQLKLHQLRVQLAQAKLGANLCHPAGPAKPAPRNDRSECVDNPLAKGCS